MPQRILAKLTRPRLQGILARGRLFDDLDGAGARPLTWIAGPPGSGKTTLVASWLEARDLPGIWYRADAGDSDAFAFFSLLRKAARGGLRTLPEFRPEPLVQLRDFSRNFFRALFGLLPENSVVVVDGFHYAVETLSVMLGEAAEEIPQGARLVVIARDDPPTSFARLHMNGGIAQIGWEQLCLTREETLAIASGAGIDAASAEQLHTASAGWVAAVRLMIEQHQRRKGEPSGTRLPTRDAIFGYLAAEIFDDLPDPVRDILLRTSLMLQITPRQAATLTGNPAAGEALEALSKRNFFVERLFGDTAVYQVHALFQEFLKAHAGATLGFPAMSELRRRTAHVLLSAGQTDDAIPLLCECGEWVQAGNLVLQEASHMLARGRGPTLRKWLAALPAWYVELTPRLLYCLGVAQCADDPIQARQTLERAYERFFREANVLGQALAAASVIQTYYIAFDHYIGIDKWTAALSEALSASPAFPTREAELHAYSMLLFSMTCQHLDAALIHRNADRVLALISHGPEVNQAIASGSLLLTLLAQLAPEKARLLVAFIKPKLASPDVTPVNRVWWLLAECYHWSHEGDSGQLQACVQQVSAVSANPFMKNSPAIMAMLRIFEHLACPEASISPQDVSTADKLIDPRRRQEQLVYLVYASHFSLSRRDPDMAVDLARRAIEIARETRHRFAELDALDMLASALVEQGDGNAALRTIREAQEIAGPLRSAKLDFSHALLEAAAEFLRGEAELAQSLLRKALRAGREGGYTRCHFWVPATMSRLLAHAVDAGIEVRYAGELIRQNRLAPPADTPCDAWPWAVRVFVLGPFRVLIDDAPLAFSGKTQRKPLELLKLLTTRGQTGVGTGMAAHLLWPDAEGDAGESALRMTVHRLRKLLRQDEALLVQDGRIRLNEARCWVDAWSFDSACEALESTPAEPHDKEAPQRAGNQVLTLYRGPAFDNEAVQSWMLPARNRWRERYVAAVSRLGRFEQSLGRWERATGIYRSGIEAEPLCEDLYQFLMRCHLEEGKRVEAYAVYRRCREVLSITLGLKPSAQTEALRHMAAQETAEIPSIRAL